MARYPPFLSTHILISLVADDRIFPSALTRAALTDDEPTSTPMKQLIPENVN